MTRPLDRLHGAPRWHPHLDGVAFEIGGEHLEQVPDGKGARVPVVGPGEHRVDRGGSSRRIDPAADAHATPLARSRAFSNRARTSSMAPRYRR